MKLTYAIMPVDKKTQIVHVGHQKAPEVTL